MNIGEKLLDLRKAKKLSQEEVADKLNVTRQTISKWETNQSTPDFDKIAPLCELYEISADELLTGKKGSNEEVLQVNADEDLIKSKKAKGIGTGVLLYFIALAWIMITIPVLKVNPILSTAIFLIICGVATYLIVCTCIIYRKKKTKEEEETTKLVKQINNVISMIILIIYLLLSFTTMAWHITWILWIVYGLIEEIVKLVFMLRSNKNEE